ncbi:thiamine phosphate synthase [uncultured Prevotella sp.]|uniref:thiamine phosphate synthase n=1 Tax=uncultured Prevotella sp. TaxID=159272 RepID=UPI002630583F|nr:thiamine phosphate synthase [uncultured Prevotella sp.]
MKWIVITQPDFIPGEALFIDRLFSHGLDLLHLRKPESDIGDCKRLLDEISPEWLPKIVVHDHFELCSEYGLGGVHLNGRNPMPPQGHKGTLSRSCHSMEEIEKYMTCCDYLTLSPIFNSISKQGYMAAFTADQLLAAKSKGLINQKVVALGGVTLHNIPQVKDFGFGGVAVLGDVWQRVGDAYVDDYLYSLRMAL